MDNYSIGVRVQQMTPQEQTLLLSQIAETRSGDPGFFTPADLGRLFMELSLPAPAKVTNILSALKKKGYVVSSIRGHWKLTPVGRQQCGELLSQIDLAALAAEASIGRGSLIGHAIHTVIPPSLAPPALLSRLREFLTSHPFETNVFGMTRFPIKGDEVKDLDPVRPALLTTREVCRLHGLEFHLASDRAIDDDLWTNVAAHMWASRYGIAFFEDRRGRGMNYNLAIEVGGMLISGRRCALLKDTSIEQMPTDLVGRIYKAIDLDDTRTVSSAIHQWLRDDLSLGRCSQCPL